MEVKESDLNAEAVRDFWYWINERHNIFLKRVEDEPKPWTDDPILQHWRFCNPFRVNDKQTRWLIDNVILPHWGDNPALLLFNIFLFRAFNIAATYEQLGWQTDWNPEAINEKLGTWIKENNLTSGAYMIRGRKGLSKYQSIVMTLTEIWKNKEQLLRGIRLENTMENAQNIIVGSGFWGWGPFTVYQVVLDLTYTPILMNPKDINEWCEFGPGAKRGIREIYPEAFTKDYIPVSKKLLQMQKKYRGAHVPTLTLQDIEFSLCELGKYRRIKSGGRGKVSYAGNA